MRQRITPGGTIEVPTADEIVRLIPRPLERTRMRVPSSLQLNAAGSGTVDVYKVPIGYRFEVRRVFITCSCVTEDLSTTRIPLNTPGVNLQYLRSGVLMEYGSPVGPPSPATPAIPGIQTWGKEQGPEVANGEIFQVRAFALATALPAAASQTLDIALEGILTRPSSGDRSA